MHIQENPDRANNCPWSKKWSIITLSRYSLICIFMIFSRFFFCLKVRINHDNNKQLYVQSYFEKCWLNQILKPQNLPKGAELIF